VWSPLFLIEPGKNYFIGKMLIYISECEFCFRNTTENFVLCDVGYRFA
jgi:hypothetical protein